MHGKVRHITIKAMISVLISFYCFIKDGRKSGIKVIWTALSLIKKRNGISCLKQLPHIKTVIARISRYNVLFII